MVKIYLKMNKTLFILYREKAGDDVTKITNKCIGVNQFIGYCKLKETCFDYLISVRTSCKANEARAINTKMDKPKRITPATLPEVCFAPPFSICILISFS